ncbi:MAG: hypothetical protein JNK61_06460 [Bacteroidia bacterium]|nr:hypothetical protein [Bacteroidia bacterium]
MRLTHNLHVILKLICSLLIISGDASAQIKTPCTLEQRYLFKLPRQQLTGNGPVVFKMAAANNGQLAFVCCNKNVVFIFDTTGVLIDSIALPFTNCVRQFDFDEYNRLLIIENSESCIYRLNLPGHNFEKLSYNKPEDWYYNINKYFSRFDLSSIPAYYYNPNYIQESYFTRFAYGYNLYLSYTTGLLYQTNFNFIKRIGDKRTYEGLKKKDLWFSDLINNKSKILLIDDTTKRATYFDRSLKLITEDFVNEQSEIIDCGRGVTEAAQFDFAVSIQQDKIFGVNTFDNEWIYFSCWLMPNRFYTND